MLHQRPEELTLQDLEALRTHLTEESATLREDSPWITDSKGIIAGYTLDVLRQANSGKKGVPKDKLMLTKLMKKAPVENFKEIQAQGEQVADHVRARAAEKKRLRALAAAKSGPPKRPEIAS